MARFVGLFAAVFGVAIGLFEVLRHLLGRQHRVGDALVCKPTDDTRRGDNGAVKSVQGAEIVFPEEILADEWKAENLERLARTYWAFLGKVTLGLVRVTYQEKGRAVTFVFPWLKLLTFTAPIYDVGDDRGNVRWNITGGLLAARNGRDGSGYLEIDVRRHEADPGQGAIYVQTTVANFYPMLASTFSNFFYANTQSRLHVLVAYAFFRRVAQRNLDESVSKSFTHDLERAQAAQAAV